MPSAEHAVVGGAVPSTANASVGATRIVVFLTLSTFCERFDFDPGGLGGFARIYPHIMVQSNVPLQKIEATIRMDRPAETTDLSNPVGDGPSSCCIPPYDGAMSEIRTLLVADYNNNPSILVPTPIWSNIFGYYEARSAEQAGITTLHVVRSDRPNARQGDGLVERDFALFDLSVIVPGNWETTTRLEKLPRQGEFDNIHVAPRLKLLNVASLVFPYAQEDTSDLRVPIDAVLRRQLRLDEIAMAPICAHDCFHLHWRWPVNASAKQALGWNEDGPYRVQGAAMVPLNQDIFLSMRSAHEFSYHAIIAASDGSELFPGEWQVVMHHGAAYPSAVHRFLKLMASLSATASSGAIFCNAEGQQVTPVESTALFYWTLRYTVVLDGGTPKLVERVRTSDANLLEARRL